MTQTCYILVSSTYSCATQLIPFASVHPIGALRSFQNDRALLLVDIRIIGEIT